MLNAKVIDGSRWCLWRGRVGVAEAMWSVGIKVVGLLRQCWEWEFPRQPTGQGGICGGVRVRVAKATWNVGV